MSRGAASLAIVLFLCANMVRLKAFGFDPPLPVPEGFNDIATSRPDVEYSTGSAPIRAAAVVPMIVLTLFIRDRSWMRHLGTGPGVWYWLLMAWLILTVPVSLLPLQVASSTAALVGVSLTVAWFTIEFGWLSLVRLVTGFVGAFTAVSMIWSLFRSHETFVAGRFQGVGMAATHFGEACGIALLLLVLYRRVLFRPLLSVGLMGLLSVSLLLSGTRGALGATIVGLVVYFGVRSRVHLATVLCCLLAITPILIFTPMLDGATVAVRRSPNEVGLSGRLEIWDGIAADAGELAPTGVGYGLVFGGQSEYLTGQFKEGVASPSNLTYSHNMLVGVFVVGGVIGLVLFGGLLAAYLWSTRRSSDRRLDAVLAFCVAVGISEAAILEAPMRVVSIVLVGLLTTVALGSHRDDGEGRNTALISEHPARSEHFGDQGQLTSSWIG